MAYFRIEELNYGTGLTENSSDKIDLPDHGSLSGLILQIGDEQKSANAGQDNWRIQDNITKIEVIANGHEVITSLTGRELQALYFYNTGHLPPNVNREYASNTQWTTFALPFGRYFKDPKYGLQLDDFSNVELKITNTCGSTYWASNLQLDLHAVLMEEAGTSPYSGYFKKAEWKTYTPAQNTMNYMDLPEENPLRAVMIMADPAITSTADDTYFHNCMYEIQYMMRTGKVKLYDSRASTLSHINAVMHGMVFADGRCDRTGGTSIRTGVGRRTSLVMADSTHTAAAHATSSGTNDGTKNTAVIYAGSENEAWWLARGESLENTVYFSHKEPVDDVSSYIDTVKEATVELNIKTKDSSSADNGTNRIVLDELIRK